MHFRYDNQSFLVLSRKQMSRFEYDKPYVVISITDPDQPQAFVPAGKGLLDTLRLQFYDITTPTIVDARNNVLSCITDEQVRQAVRFVERWREDGVLFVVHCEAGISWSAATAAAISKFLNGDDQPFFLHLHPNRLVYRKVFSALMRQDEDAVEVPAHWADDGPVEW